MTRAQVLSAVLAEHDRNPATALCSCGLHQDFSLPFEHRAHVAAALDAALAAQDGGKYDHVGHNHGLFRGLRSPGVCPGCDEIRAARAER